MGRLLGKFTINSFVLIIFYYIAQKLKEMQLDFKKEYVKNPFVMDYFYFGEFTFIYSVN